MYQSKEDLNITEVVVPRLSFLEVLVKAFFTLLVLTFFVLAALWGYERYLSSPSDFSLKKETYEKLKWNAVLPLKTSKFFEDSLFELIPFGNRSFYLEAQGVSEFLKFILPPQKADEFYEASGLTFGEASLLLEEEFAVFGDGKYIGFVARVKDSKQLAEKLESFSQFNSFSAALLEDPGLLVVSDSPTLALDVENAYKKVILSFANSPKFIRAKASLPSEGQIFAFGEGELLRFLLPETIASGGERGYVVRRSEDGATEVLISD